MAGSVASIIHTVSTLVPLWPLAIWLLTLTICVAVYRNYRDPLSKIPGPILSQWTSVVDKSYYVRGHRHDYVHSLHEKYGAASQRALIVRSCSADTDQDKDPLYATPLAKSMSLISTRCGSSIRSRTVTARRTGIFHWRPLAFSPS